MPSPEVEPSAILVNVVLLWLASGMAKNPLGLENITADSVVESMHEYRASALEMKEGQNLSASCSLWYVKVFIDLIQPNSSRQAKVVGY